VGALQRTRDRQTALVGRLLFVAVAIDYAHNNKVADFIDVLRAAKETATISHADRTFEYDVTQLPAAQAHFLQLCNETSAHYGLERKCASACCPASSLDPTKLAFSRNAFVQFFGMFDVIFKFTVPLG
jgi:hypothetical protein